MDISEQFIEQTIAFSLLVIEKIIKQLGKTYQEDLAYSEFYTLSIVNYFGNMSMTSLADTFGIQKQQATRVVDKLVKKGYVKRAHDYTDRRIVLIHLTSKARSFFKEYTAKAKKEISESLSGLSEKEIREFQAAVERINHMMMKMKDAKA